MVATLSFSYSLWNGEMLTTLFVPLLYHIYKHLSIDLNAYFKMFIIIIFFTHKGEGISPAHCKVLTHKGEGISLSELFITYSLTHKG